MSGWLDTEETAARWLIRSEEPGWTEVDQVEMDAWIAADDINRTTLWRLRRAWRSADRLAALRAPDEIEPESVAPQSGKRRLYLVAIGIAAAIGGVALILPHLGGLGAERFVTDVGARRAVALADGSRIELNTATRLRTAVDTHKREVWLDRGEAYFDVAHDPERPFVVHAGQETVTVLGTRFSVRRDGERIRVAVISGRVRVDEPVSRRAPGSNVLKPGATAVVDGDSTMVARQSVEQVTDTLSWREGRLVFDKATLGEAVAEFNRYNRKQLVIADPAVADIRIGGRFEAANVDAFIRLLRRGFGLRIEDNGDRATISA